MKRIYIFAFAILAFSGAIFAANTAAVSLNQAVQTALQKNPDAAAAQALADAARANVKIAHANYLPQIDLGLSYTRQTYNYGASPGTSPSQWALFYKGQSNANAPYYFGGLNLSQTILDFGRTKGQVEVSQAQFEAAEHNLQFVRDQIYYNVRAAYYTVIAAEDAVNIQKAAVKDAGRHLDQARAFHQFGTVPGIDVTSEQLALANARLGLQQADESLDVDRSQLATTMGLPVDQAPEPSETLESPRKTGSLKQLLAEAEQSRQDLLAQFDQVKASMGNLLTAKAQLRPNLSLSTFLDFRNLTWPLVYNWSLGQMLAQSIFAGGANRARVRGAQAQEVAAQEDVASLRLLVDQQVFSALSGLRLAEDQINNAAVADGYARENLALAEGRYKVGVGDVVELNDAEYQATQAALQLVSTRYDYQVASAKLDFVLGHGPK
ncbi:MAG: TolC family protein [Terriglobia bacterium]